MLWAGRCLPPHHQRRFDVAADAIEEVAARHRLHLTRRGDRRGVDRPRVAAVHRVADDAVRAAVDNDREQPVAAQRHLLGDQRVVAGRHDHRRAAGPRRDADDLAPGRARHADPVDGAVGREHRHLDLGVIAGDLLRPGRGQQIMLPFAAVAELDRGERARRAMRVGQLDLGGARQAVGAGQDRPVGRRIGAEPVIIGLLEEVAILRRGAGSGIAGVPEPRAVGAPRAAAAAAGTLDVGDRAIDLAPGPGIVDVERAHLAAARRQADGDQLAVERRHVPVQRDAAVGRELADVEHHATRGGVARQRQRRQHRLLRLGKIGQREQLAARDLHPPVGGREAVLQPQQLACHRGAGRLGVEIGARAGVLRRDPCLDGGVVTIFEPALRIGDAHSLICVVGDRVAGRAGRG